MKREFVALPAVGAVLLAGCDIAAQSAMFRDVTAERLPEILGACMDAAAGDADGDGDPDLALAMEFEPNRLLLNDGNGRFTDASDRLPRAVHDSEDIAFADFDGDGDLDLVLVSEDDRTDELYLNDGRGRFTAAGERLPTDDVSNAHAVVDIDGDGDVDILTGNVGMNRLLSNDGEARFADLTDTAWPQSGISRTQDIEVADIDGDGDPDVIVGNEGQNEIFVNANGVLRDETASRLPARDDETREIRAGDLDGDGDLDLVVANVAFLMDVPARDYVLLNDGTGVFRVGEPGRYPEDGRSNFTVQLADVDGDDDLDALLPATSFAADGAGDTLVLINDGDAWFSPADRGRILPVAATGNGFDIEVADFDGDGRAELFMCNRASNRNAADRSGGRQRLLTPD